MEKTIRLTTAQALVKFIHQQYIEIDGEKKLFVEGVFNIFGHGNVLGIGQALEQHPGHLKIYQGKNEQSMALAAIAYGKEQLRRKIYAVTTSVGPGAANLVAAAGTALANNLPVLLLPGDTFATRQPDPVLQQIEQAQSPGITTNDALKPVSRYWDRITRPEQLMSSLIHAFDVLTNPETSGPVTICLSQDVEGEAYDYPLSFFQERVHYLDRRTPTDRELKELIAALRESQYPLIVVGGGAKYSGARDILIKLSDTHGIPLVETQAGKSTVESSFKHNLGGLGVTGNLAANKAAAQADLIIGVGTRYTDFTTGSKSLFNFEEASFVNINVSRTQAYKLDALPVVGDARATLELLSQHLGDYTSAYNNQLSLYQEEWQKERQRLAGITFDREQFTPEVADQFTQAELIEYADALETEMIQTRALLMINNLIPHAVIVGSAGSLPGDLQRLWESSQPNTYHVEYGYSCMGYEIAGALGAKLAHPDKEVYAMVGDGSFLMLHTELVTSLQYHKKINVLLFDNAGYGCINNLQMSNGSNSFYTELKDSESHQPMVINYAQVAAGYGAKTYEVHTYAELKAALADAATQAVSTLIDIKVLPKTMTDGYDAWWHVGVAEVSEKSSIQTTFNEKNKGLNQAKPY